MIWRPESGIRWWMSATRPATEFSTGIIASRARPPRTAAKASSNCAQGNVVISGKTRRQARSEYAPGAPWNEIVRATSEEHFTAEAAEGCTMGVKDRELFAGIHGGPLRILHVLCIKACDPRAGGRARDRPGCRP